MTQQKESIMLYMAWILGISAAAMIVAVNVNWYKELKKAKQPGAE